METLDFDVLIIGAGQAGLAAGQALQQLHRPIRFLLADRSSRVGDSWRRRYKSLVLFTPRAYSALPGLPVPGDPEGLPSKDEIADYLESYAKYFMLPIRPLTEVNCLEKTPDGFMAVTDDGLHIHTRAVIVASGAFQKPDVPRLAQYLSPSVFQRNSVTYYAPEELPPGIALVVGDGATGRQIALEIAARQPVILAATGHHRPQPQRILGKHLFWWADHLGLLDTPVTSTLASFLLRGDTFPGQHLTLDALRDRGVQVEGRLAGTSGRIATFRDGTTQAVDAVVWATGYREDDRFIEIPYAKNNHGALTHYRGVTPAPGLFVLGRSWQWTRSSSLLHGVGADAAFIAQAVDDYLANQKPNVYSPDEAAELMR